MIEITKVQKSIYSSSKNNYIIHITNNITKENKMTNQYNDNMIPAIIFDEFEHVLIFVDIKNNVCCKNSYATIEWLEKNNIEIEELERRCDTEYEAIDNDFEYGIVAYFSEDKEAIYNYSKQIDVGDAYEKIFNF